jgi:uncharacterized membrane protein YeaQ/YmgE (transglycosylase-associated protein family)
MTITGLIVLLLVAALAGGIGQALSGFSRGGCLVSIVFGFVGAYIGTWIATQFGLPEFFALNIDGQVFPLIWAIVGAALLSGVLALFFRGGRVYRW